MRRTIVHVSGSLQKGATPNLKVVQQITSQTGSMKLSLRCTLRRSNQIKIELSNLSHDQIQITLLLVISACSRTGTATVEEGHSILSFFLHKRVPSRQFSRALVTLLCTYCTRALHYTVLVNYYCTFRNGKEQYFSCLLQHHNTDQ